MGCVAQPHSRGPATNVISECPRGARMALKDYSDDEAVRSRGQDHNYDIMNSKKRG